MFGDLLDTLAAQDLVLMWPLLLAFLTLDASVGVGPIVPGDALLVVAGTTAGSPPDALALIAAGVVACVAGALGMPYRRFMPWAVIGGTAWVSTYETLGAVAGGVVREHAELLLPVAAVAALVIVAVSAAVRRAISPARAGSPEPSSASRPPR
ncbi:hypothetical protein AB0G06_25950 [Nonomuraea dietziae]|uniref:hypothetical protein n=2 Tax=Nonomuraea dietziae TaxID=65515 RepID=UPI003401BE66